MKIYSTWQHLISLGDKDGLARGTTAGASRQSTKLLLRHGKRLLGPPSEQQQELLHALADLSALTELEEVRDRLLGASDWAGLLANIALPVEGPIDPDYLLPFDFDPEPMPPSIDVDAKMKRLTGEPMIFRLRLQRVYQEDIGAVLYEESQQMEAQHGCSVETAVLLLWPGADGPVMTGRYALPGGGAYRYHLSRLWEREPDEMFASVSTMPYAPLGKGAAERLPELLRRLEEAIDEKAEDEEMKGKLWVVAYGSMGLIYPAERVNELLAHKLPFLYQRHECRSAMSEGYYAGQSRGLGAGALEATRRWVLALGGRRLGEPPAELARAVATIRELDRLEQLAARALKGGTWQEVMAPN